MEEESEDIYHLVGSTGGGQLHINLTSDHQQDRDSSYQQTDDAAQHKD